MKQIYKKRVYKLSNKYIINPYQFIEDPEDSKVGEYSNDFEEVVGYDIYNNDPQNRKLEDPTRLLFYKLEDYLEEDYYRGLFDSDKALFNFVANFIKNDGYIE